MVIRHIRLSPPPPHPPIPPPPPLTAVSDAGVAPYDEPTRGYMCQGHKLEETASLFVSCYISNLYPSVYYSTVYHSINIRGGVEGGGGGCWKHHWAAAQRSWNLSFSQLKKSWGPDQPVDQISHWCLWYHGVISCSAPPCHQEDRPRSVLMCHTPWELAHSHPRTYLSFLMCEQTVETDSVVISWSRGSIPAVPLSVSIGFERLLRYVKHGPGQYTPYFMHSVQSFHAQHAEFTCTARNPIQRRGTVRAHVHTQRFCLGGSGAEGGAPS